MKLRPHQTEIINKTRQAIFAGCKRPVIFAPCSFGKTIVAAEISRLAVEKGNKVLFIVHRRLLCEQTKEKFDAFGINSSIIMSGYQTDFTAPVMITTIQTYTRRIKLNDPQVNIFFHDAAVIFVDECHLGISPSYQNVYSFYENKVIIGLTGSPARADQRGLGEVFEALLESAGIKELTEEGYLTPVRYFAGKSPNLKGIAISGGDFNREQLEKKSNTKKLVGDVVQNWLKLAGNRRTIVFSCGVKHSIALRDNFAKYGLSVAHLDANSKHEERIDVLDRFKTGEIQIVTNCQLFTEGYDADFVDCVVVARSTKSLPLWVQMVGRAQRIFDGKKDALLLDHGGNIERHGFIDEPVIWTLDGKTKAWKKAKSKREKKPVECTACGHVFEGSNICSLCGSPVKAFGKKVECTDDELEEIKGKKKASVAEKRIFLGMLKYYVNDKGWSHKAVNARYREMYNCWPHHSINDVGYIEPDQKFLNMMKYMNIKYAKRRSV